MAKDLFHEIVRRALIKNGWTITHDPYEIPVQKGLDYEIDFGAEKVIIAERGVTKIAVKVFFYPNI